MTIEYEKMDSLVRNTIEDLIDKDVNSIYDSTKLDDIGLVSLDFITIKVEIQKEFDKEVDLDKLSESGLETYGQLIDFLAT